MTKLFEIDNPYPNMVLLVANRGEIARRVIRAAVAWNLRTVAVYADPDSAAPHVDEASSAERIGPAALDESYLSIPAILDAAERSGATHIHPGYGFLSENAEFAAAVVEAGLTWVGPEPAHVSSMGSKIQARSMAAAAGVPVIPGFDASQDDEALADAATNIGYPVLVKASAGGGGKGIRIANSPDDFAQALSEARTEASRAFGDDAVIVERYITRPRHIEVQVAGDKHGTVIELGTRECSVQRRYQKVLEEAPAPNLPDSLDREVRDAALSLVSAIGYDSVGTVEFILDANSNEFFFLEMNTRIQVEHTVTEELTGIDLIQLQLALACGVAMPLPADAFDLVRREAPRRCSIEARINCEDAWAGFLPQSGTVDVLEVPEAAHIRWDSAIVEGSEITPFYDSMIGKLIVTGDGRMQTLDRLSDALDQLLIGGVVTNVDFHRWLLQQAPVRSAQVTTRFLDEVPLPRISPFDSPHPLHSRESSNSPKSPKSPWSVRLAQRFTPHRSTQAFDSASRDDRWLGNERQSESRGSVLSPFPGMVTEVLVEDGQDVLAGETLFTIEAMKMLHPITAVGPGRIANVAVTTGDQIVGKQLLATFEPPDVAEQTSET